MDTKRIVVPGDIIEITQDRPRNGIFKCSENDFCSSYFGVVQSGNGFVDVVPFYGRYVPRRGDKVIGKVIDIGPSMWTIDINSAYLTMLHSNDSPWRVNSGELKKYLSMWDYVYAKVMTVNELKESWITLRDVGLRKLEGGHIISVPSPKVPRIIGKGGNMVNMIKDATSTRIVLGQNGLIWIDGSPENIMNAVSAIRMVEREAHTNGLTDRVENFLKGLKGGS